ncbi:telomeric repeat-binding factor [Nannochloropsis oceanica]
MAPAVDNPSISAAAAELLCMMDWAAHFRDHSTLQALARTSNDAGLSIPSNSVLFKRLLLAGLDEASGIAKVEEDFESVLSILTEAEGWLLRGVPGHDLFDLKLKIRRQLVLSPLRNSLPDDLDSVSMRSLATLNNERYWYLLDKIFPLETSRRASLSGSDAAGWVSPGARHEGEYRKVVEIKERKQLLDVMRGDGSPLDGDNMDMNKVLYLLKTYSKEGFLAEVGQFTRQVESKLLPDPEPFKEGGEVWNGGGGRRGREVASLLGRDPRTVLSAAGRARERLQNWSRASGLVSTEHQNAAKRSSGARPVECAGRCGRWGGGGGGGRAGGVGGRTTNKKKRLNDPTRKGRLITFEDSQYAGSESSTGGEEEEDHVSVSESRRQAAARQRRTQTAAAAAAAAARLADRRKKSQRGKPAALPPMSGERCRDVGEEAEEEEMAGERDEEQEEIRSTTESSSSSSGSEEEDEERERIRALKRGGGRRVLAAKRKARLQIEASGRSKRRQPKTHRSFWSSDEVADLKQAVLHDGMKGRWADILNSPKYLHLDFKLRTSVDLKDKWRGLERKAAAKGVTVEEVN